MNAPPVEQCLSLFYRLHSLPLAAALQSFTAEDMAALKWLVDAHLERERVRLRAARGGLLGEIASPLTDAQLMASRKLADDFDGAAERGADECGVGCALDALLAEVERLRAFGRERMGGGQ